MLAEMVLPLLVIGGLAYLAFKRGAVASNDDSSSVQMDSYMESEKNKIEMIMKELEANLQHCAGTADLLNRIKESPADRELRNSFFLMFKIGLLLAWAQGYEERGGFVHPEDQAEIKRPHEWLEFPEYYEMALQPRLSADALEILFIISIIERYPEMGAEQMIGAVANIYSEIYGTLDTLAGKLIYQQLGEHPDPEDQKYHDVRRQVNKSLGLNGGFKEVLDAQFGDAFSFFDKRVALMRDL